MIQPCNMNEHSFILLSRSGNGRKTLAFRRRLSFNCLHRPKDSRIPGAKDSRKGLLWLPSLDPLTPRTLEPQAFGFSRRGLTFPRYPVQYFNNIAFMWLSIKSSWLKWLFPFISCWVSFPLTPVTE